jgi:hypothetical protein
MKAALNTDPALSKTGMTLTTGYTDPPFTFDGGGTFTNVATASGVDSVSTVTWAFQGDIDALLDPNDMNFSIGAHIIRFGENQEDSLFVFNGGVVPELPKGLAPVVGLVLAGLLLLKRQALTL